MSRAIGFALVATGLLAVAGCARDPALAGLERLAAAATRAAGRPPPGPAERPIPYPLPRDRRMKESEYRVGVLDFFALQRCGVREGIAERNSVLGRLQDTGRRLAYEHELLVALRDCLDSLRASQSEEDAALEPVVSEAVTRLGERLPAVRWNAGFGSHELAASFAPGGPGIPPEPSAGRAQAEALDRLAGAVASVGQPGARIDRESLVAAQEVLEKGRYGARLHRALAAATDRLSVAAESLEALADGGCPASGVLEIRQALRAGGLGAWLENLRAQGRAWFDAMSRLRLASPAPPEGFGAWLSAEADPDRPDGRWRRFEAAHARFGAALARCREDGPGR